MTIPSYDVLIVGAGPSGLSCAIEAKKRGLRYLVVEQGGITDAVRRFPTEMIFYSTPEMLSLAGLPFYSTNVRPSRAEALRYYRSVVQFFELDLALHRRIVAAERLNQGGFSIHDHLGQTYSASQLIIATGYFDIYEPLQVPGEDLPHVSHRYEEAYKYTGSKVAVVGGASSAVDTALDLYRNDVDVTMIHRGETFSDAVKYWVRPDIENRIKQKSITAYFSTTIEKIEAKKLHLRSAEKDVPKEIAIDFVLLMIGYRPDTNLLDQLGAEYDPQSLIPKFNNSFRTTVDDLYIAGSTTCGCETATVFIENGRLHAQTIFEDICR